MDPGTRVIFHYLPEHISKGELDGKWGVRNLEGMLHRSWRINLLYHSAGFPKRRFQTYQIYQI